MNTLPPASQAGLEPVRLALRATADARVAEVLDDARRQAEALLEAARTESQRILTEAAREGAEAARAQSTLRSSRARREGHELVLAQRSALLAELRRCVREEAARLRTDARYPALVEQLTQRCRELLGPGAAVTEGPDGGVIAQDGPRRLDLSLPALADLALESLPGVDEPWLR